MFKDKVIWITGASSGLGKYLAYEFAKHGAKLALSARRKDQLNEVLTNVESVGAEGLVVPCDVLIEEEIEGAIQTILTHFGSLDIAIATAGFGVVGKIKNLSKEEWRRQLDVNVIGLALTVKHAFPLLKESGGSIVLIGSVANYLPNPGVGAYGASKAAVHSIGQTLQIELKGTGVNCTVIHPGFVDSDIARVDNQGVLHPENTDPRPANLMWPTEKAAKVMVRAIAKKKKVYVFTGHGKVLAFIGQHFPAIGRWLVGKMS